MALHAAIDRIVEGFNLIFAIAIHGIGNSDGLRVSGTIGRGGLCVRRVLWIEGWVGAEELTTHAERLISSSSLDVGVSCSYPSLYQKFMAKGEMSCTIPWREDVFLFAEVLWQFGVLNRTTILVCERAGEPVIACESTA